MDAWIPVVAAVVALGGPLLGYLVAARKTSGRIRSSDASELWEEARAIRRECADRVRALETRNKELEELTLHLTAENMRLTRISFGDGHA